jgi:hypothetical protein
MMKLHQHRVKVRMLRKTERRGKGQRPKKQLKRLEKILINSLAKLMRRRKSNLNQKILMARAKEKKVKLKRRKRVSKHDTNLFIMNPISNIDKKKKKEYAPREQDNSEIRLLGSWSPGDWKQTVDYSIPVSQ